MSALNKILYVEDEIDIQSIAKIALESVGGFSLKVCSSGKEALESISSFAPDMVLLDVMMPEMDGPATLEAIRKLPEYTSIPIIFMTAKVQPSEVEELKSLGAMDVISKPFDPMTLSEQIKQIWEKHS
ncbi:MAG: response regulator [Spirochaetia bacterium]|nr:response regulator [Spirochaetia bacterium]